MACMSRDSASCFQSLDDGGRGNDELCGARKEHALLLWASKSIEQYSIWGLKYIDDSLRGSKYTNETNLGRFGAPRLLSPNQVVCLWLHHFCTGLNFELVV